MIPFSDQCLQRPIMRGTARIFRKLFSSSSRECSRRSRKSFRYKPCIYQADHVFSAALVAGAAAWKDRPAAFLLFIMFWTTFVYDPISRSTWSPEGFSNTRGGLDFAGGTAVHICAAATVAAHCVYHKYLLRSYERLIPRFGRTIRHIFVQRSEAGPRRPEPRVKSIPDRIPLQQKEPPQVTNHVNILVGTIFLWLGWFGFNGGSALGANLRAGAACVSTHVAAVTGAVFHSISHAAVVYWWTRRSRNAANNAVANPVRAQDGHEMEDMAGGMVNRQSQNVVRDLGSHQWHSAASMALTWR